MCEVKRVILNVNNTNTLIVSCVCICTTRMLHALLLHEPEALRGQNYKEKLNFPKDKRSHDKGEQPDKPGYSTVWLLASTDRHHLDLSSSSFSVLQKNKEMEGVDRPQPVAAHPLPLFRVHTPPCSRTHAVSVSHDVRPLQVHLLPSLIPDGGQDCLSFS